MLCRLPRVARVALVVSSLLAARAAAATTVQPGNIGTQTWTPAGSPYLATGDITVPTGATLTIQAGTVVQFAAGDANNSGISATQTELTVAGTLLVQGSRSSPVTFAAQTGTTSGTWYGIVAGATAAASIKGAVIAEAQIGISGATTSASGGLLMVGQTLVQNSVVGMSVVDAVISQVRISGMAGVGISISGSGSIINAIVDHCASGISTENATSNAAVIVENCSIDRNGSAGVLATGASGSSVSLVNDLITNNGEYGIERGVVSISSSSCDVWNNSLANYLNLSAGTGSISADPLYVSATDYHLQAGSPAIDVGTNVGAPGQDFDLGPRPQDGDGINGAQFDMGAYEYVMATGTGGAGGGTGGASGGTGGTGGGGTGGAGGGTGGAGGGTGGAGGAGGTGVGGAGIGAGGTGGASGGGAGSSGRGGNSGTGGSSAAGTSGAAGSGGGAGSQGAGGRAGAPGTGGGAGVAGGGIGGGVAGTGGGGVAGSSAAGRGGGGGAGGGGGEGGGTAGRDAGADGPPAGGGSSGCGCQMDGDGWGPLSLALAAAVALLAGRRRRRLS